MNFHDLKMPVQEQFNRMAKHDLFVVDVNGDDLWQFYLAAFPTDSNPIYRKRTEHDCSCCRQFIKNIGAVVSIVDGKLQSIWDGPISDPGYRAVALAMGNLVKAQKIDRPFLHFEKHCGTDVNRVQTKYDPLRIEEYHHFYVDIPHARNTGKNFYCEGKDIATKVGEMKSTHDVFARSLETLTMDALDTVIELIANKSLYRGEEQVFAVMGFRDLKKQFDAIKPVKADMSTWWAQKDLFFWSMYDKVPTPIARIRNTAIGTLLIDLSEDMDLEAAVRKFETSVMAPQNYQRPTALVSKAMVEKARATVAELGIGDALERRHARLTDIAVTDILFADRNARKAMGGDVFDDIATKSSKPKNLDKVETVTIDAFVRDILPKVESLEVMFENQHRGNLVSLIAPAHQSSRPIFKWSNRFSWTYNGEVSDSIKEKVKRAGGNVSGDLCCRLAWFNHDDLDFHMIEPNRHQIYFRAKGPSPCCGYLDVDMNAGGGTTREPVENIFYSRREYLKEGEYFLCVHQYAKRETDNVGFEVEIDWLGDVQRFVYDKPVKQGETIRVARMRYSRASGIEILESLPSTQASKTVWGLNTQDFHRVTTMMLSPNYWGPDHIGHGNKHFFFMLDGCINDDRPRGFFNEYLIDELKPHRKVIEIIGSKLKVESSASQLSGLGFSSTQRAEVLVRAKGTFSRVLKIAF